jgi:hypothetical protein
MNDAAHNLSMTKKIKSNGPDIKLAVGYGLLLLSLISGCIRAFTVGPILDGSLLLTLLMLAAGFKLAAQYSPAEAKPNSEDMYDYDEEPSWPRR